ncbi:unnamed protein product [Peronospora effusa]|nr:unnamed protein product [Peronospora effusa]
MRAVSSMWWIKGSAFDMEVVSDVKRWDAPVEQSIKDVVGSTVRHPFRGVTALYLMKVSLVLPIPGGSTECKVPRCINRAKSRGFCWSHGGGTKCKAENCEKIAISNGLCWAHGGGKRCVVEGCMRQAYERTDNLCNNHYQER